MRAAVILVLTAVGLWAGGCSRVVKVSDEDIRVISLPELRDHVSRDRENDQHLLLIDPRSRPRFADGHIPGARNLLLSDVDPAGGRDPSIANHNHIVVYGKDPGSSVAKGMAKRLMSLRYKNVRFYAGGINDWIANGLPVAGGSATPE